MHPSREARFWILFFIFTTLSAINLFWLSPSFIPPNASDDLWTAQAVYVSIRLLVIMGFSLSTAAWAGLARYRVLSTTALIAFLEQGMRAIALAHTIQSDPAAWDGVQLDAVVVTLVMGYMTFLPIVMAFAWGGFEIGSALRVSAFFQKAVKLGQSK